MGDECKQRAGALARWRADEKGICKDSRKSRCTTTNPNTNPHTNAHMHLRTCFRRAVRYGASEGMSPSTMWIDGWFSMRDAIWFAVSTNRTLLFMACKR